MPRRSTLGGMRLAVTLALVALSLGACSFGSAGTSGRTALTVTYWETPTSTPVRWTLRCNPARGTLPRPAVACRRLADRNGKLFAPVPPDTVCTQIYGGPQRARVLGTVEGSRLRATFTRQDGCEISRWNALAPWLLPSGEITS